MKRIVIVGTGFAGLAAAKALRHSDAEVFVVDRANHNLFQPLLYQVATTVLSPAQIASPIRGLLKNQRNTTVVLGEVGGVNKDAKCVYVSNHEDVLSKRIGCDARQYSRTIYALSSNERDVGLSKFELCP
jgi:NADH dehydrogenase